MDFTLNDFRSLFNTGKDGAASTTSVEKTEGYVTLSEGDEKSLQSVGRSWSSRGKSLEKSVNAKVDDNLDIKNKLVKALKDQGASEKFIIDVRGKLGIDANGAAVGADGGKVLLRRTLKSIIQDFDKSLVRDTMEGSLKQAAKDFREDADLRNKGMRSGAMTKFTTMAQNLLIEDVALGDSARIYFGEEEPKPVEEGAPGNAAPAQAGEAQPVQGGEAKPPEAPKTERQLVEGKLKLCSSDNLGVFAKSGLARADNAFVKKVFDEKAVAVSRFMSMAHHKIESGLGFRNLGRTAKEMIENNHARLMFLASVLEELRARGLQGVDFQNMPEEIKKKLKLSDFGSEIKIENGEIHVIGQTGKPLTARRVLEVSEAINELFGGQQKASKAGKETSVLGFLTGRIDPSQITAISASKVSAAIEDLLQKLRGKMRNGAVDSTFAVSERIGGVEVKFRCSPEGMTAEVGGKTVTVPGGVEGFVQQLESDVMNHVKFYGKAFLRREMNLLEGQGVPRELSQRDMKLAMLKLPDHQNVRNWQHEQRGRLIGFYRNVIKSVLGDENYKQLALGSLPLAGLKMLAVNALNGAYGSKKAVAALIREVADFGGKVQLSEETLIDLAKAMDAKEMADLGKKVKFAPVKLKEGQVLTYQQTVDHLAQVKRDVESWEVRKFVSAMLLPGKNGDGGAHRFLDLLKANPQFGKRMLLEHGDLLELFTAEASKQPQLAEVKDRMHKLLSDLCGTPTKFFSMSFYGNFAHLFCSASPQVQEAAQKCLDVAVKHGADSPEFNQARTEALAGIEDRELKSSLLSLIGSPDKPAIPKLKEFLALFAEGDFGISRPGLDFVAATAENDLKNADMLQKEADQIAKLDQDAKARSVHEFVADVILGHDTVVEDVDSAALTPGKKLLKTIQRNVDGFVRLFRNTDEAVKDFSFDTQLAREGEPKPEPAPDSPTMRIRSALKAAFEGITGGPEFQPTRMMTDVGLKAMFMCLASASLDGVDSPEFAETLKTGRALVAGNVLDRLGFQHLFGDQDHPVDLEAIMGVEASLNAAAGELQASVDATVDTAMASLGDAMKGVVQDAFELSDKDMDDLLSDKLDDGEKGPEFNAGDAWKKSLKDFVGESAINPKSGLGKFILRSLITYFGKVSAIDKKNMVASLIRYTKQDSDPGEVLGALLKGAGPIMQKTLQGIPTDGMPDNFAKALADMKDSLAPIDDHIVKVQLMNMIKESNGAIKEIVVKGSLGAASVGQAFLCEMTVPRPGNQDAKELCVVKLLRPDVANRAQREKGFFRNVAAHVAGMRQTFEGQLSTVLDELDLTIEAKNIRLGQVYHKNPDMRIESAQVHPLVKPTTNTLVMKLAPGKTIASAVKDCRDRMAAIKAEITTLVKGGDGTTVSTLCPKSQARYFELRHELVAMGNEMLAHNGMLISLTSEWITEAAFKEGFFHGDLHAGNIMSDGKTLTVIDFGNATKLTPTEQANVLKCVCSCSANNLDTFVEGFKALLSPSGASAFKAKEKQLSPQIASILAKGKSGDSVERIMAIISILQQNGIEIPSQINKFAQSMMRLSDAVKQTQNTVEEIKGLLSQIFCPGYTVSDMVSVRWDPESCAALMLSSSGMDSTIDNRIEHAEHAIVSFEAELRKALNCTDNGNAFAFETPEFEEDGSPKYANILGQLTQVTTSVSLYFDKAIEPLLAMAGHGVGPETLKSGEVVDHAQLAKAELAKYREKLAEVTAGLVGKTLEGDDVPLLAEGEDIRGKFMQLKGLMSDQKFIIDNKVSTKAEKNQAKAMYAKLEARANALGKAIGELAVAAEGLVKETSALYRLRCEHLIGELKSARAKEIGEPSGFEESFVACAGANVKSAIGKLGTLKGAKLAGEMDSVRDAERSVENQVAYRAAMFERLINLNVDGGDMAYPAVVTEFIGKSLCEMAQRVSMPEDFKELLQDAEWQKNPASRNRMFEVLAHNMKELHSVMVGSCGVTEKDLVSGCPGREEGRKYLGALLRVRLAGMLLFLLDGSAENPGVMQGIMDSLKTDSKQKYDQLLLQFNEWADGNPPPCEPAEAQLVRDLFMVATREATEDEIFASDLFQVDDGRTMALADKWTARDEYDRDKVMKKFNISDIGYVSGKKTKEEAFAELIKSMDGPADAQSQEWKDFFEVRKQYARVCLDYSILRMAEQTALNKLDAAEQTTVMAAELDDLKGRHAASVKKSGAGLEKVLDVRHKLDDVAIAVLKREAVLLRDKLVVVFSAQGDDQLDDVTRLRASSLQGPPASGGQVGTLRKAIGNSGRHLSREMQDKLEAVLPFLSPDVLKLLSSGARDLKQSPSGAEDFGGLVLDMVLEVAREFMNLEDIAPVSTVPKLHGPQPAKSFEQFEEAIAKNLRPHFFVSVEAQDIFEDFLVTYPDVDQTARARMDNASLVLEDRFIGQNRLLAQLRQRLLADAKVPEGGSVRERMLANSGGKTIAQLFDEVGFEPELREAALKVIENLPTHLKDALAEGGNLAVSTLKEVRGLMKELGFEAEVGMKVQKRRFPSKDSVSSHDIASRTAAMAAVFGKQGENISPMGITDAMMETFREVFPEGDGTDPKTISLALSGMIVRTEDEIASAVKRIRDDGGIPTQADFNRMASDCLRSELRALKDFHDVIDGLEGFTELERKCMRELFDRFGYRSVTAAQAMIKGLRNAGTVELFRNLVGASPAERARLLFDLNERIRVIRTRMIYAMEATGLVDDGVFAASATPVIVTAFRMAGVELDSLQPVKDELFGGTTLDVAKSMFHSLSDYRDKLEAELGGVDAALRPPAKVKRYGDISDSCLYFGQLTDSLTGMVDVLNGGQGVASGALEESSETIPGQEGTEAICDSLLNSGEMPVRFELKDLRSLFNLTGDGRFSTPVDATHGQVYLDANYELKTVNRHSSDTEGVPKDPGQNRRNVTLRNHVRWALEKAGVSKAFFARADVKELLGLDDHGVVKASATEALQRANLKRLLELAADPAINGLQA